MHIIEQIKAFISSRQTRGEILRFALVGLCSVVLQYISYRLLLLTLNPSLSLMGSYIISLLFNFYLTTHFTFRVKASTRKGIGFLFAHLLNFLLQMLFLHVFIDLCHIPKDLALLPVLAICVPTNFILVRYFVKKKA